MWKHRLLAFVSSFEEPQEIRLPPLRFVARKATHQQQAHFRSYKRKSRPDEIGL